MVDLAFVRRRFELLLLTIAPPVIKDNEKEEFMIACCYFAALADINGSCIDVNLLEKQSRRPIFFTVFTFVVKPIDRISD
ncbi:hypothetical protein L484_016582 [Morus notabilis]|uniref:Uncharacterized protein n=1 Tax=Morus notabilis TaxID=981085 RepID=W9QKB2_9ROSA|nr:hypothetical protein L484_016582 [Morus notabilis]